MKVTNLFLSALVLFCSTSALGQEDKFIWIAKPVLCGESNSVLENIKDTGFKPLAKSVITLGESNTPVGFTWFFIREDELLIIENIGSKSCVISVSKDFVIDKSNITNGL